jgi:hypothetical protein
MATRTQLLASPWPFVRVLLRPAAVVEILGVLFAAALLIAALVNSRLEPLLNVGTDGARALDERALTAIGIQVVSIVGATTAIGWYLYIDGLLRGLAAWSYPLLVARIRAAYLLVALFLAGSIGLAATLWAPALPAWPLAALGGAWAAVPLLLYWPRHVMVRLLVAVALLATAVLPMPGAALAGLPLAWIAVGAPIAGIAAIFFGITAESVRDMVWSALPTANNEARGDDEAAPDDAIPAGAVSLSVRDRARTIARALTPRWPLPGWLPRGFAVVLDNTHYVVGVLVWYLLGADPSMLLITIGSVPVQKWPDVLWPLGRAERLAVATRIAHAGMLMHGGLSLGSLLLLELLRVPRLPFGMSGTPITENWMVLPLLIAVLPIVYVTPAIPGMFRSTLQQFLRMMTAFAVVFFFSRWDALASEVLVTLGICAVVVTLTLAEQQWRLRRHFLRGDLYPVRA